MRSTLLTNLAAAPISIHESNLGIQISDFLVTCIHSLSQGSALSFVDAAIL